MRLQQFIEQQFKMYLKSDKPVFLDTYVFYPETKSLLKNEEIEDVELDLSSYFLVIVGDKRNIKFLLEVRQNQCYFHSEYHSSLHKFFEVTKINTLFELLRDEESGKIEKR